MSVSNVEWACEPILRRWRSVDKPSMFGTQVGEEDRRGAEEGRQEVCGSRLPCASIVDLRRLGQDDALRRSYLAPPCTSPVHPFLDPPTPATGPAHCHAPFSCLCTSCTPRSRPRGHAHSNVHQCALSALGQRRRSRRPTGAPTSCFAFRRNAECAAALRGPPTAGPGRRRRRSHGLISACLRSKTACPPRTSGRCGAGSGLAPPPPRAG